MADCSFSDFSACFTWGASGSVGASFRKALNAAIAAFDAFLKLAPTDPLAPQVKQALKALKVQSAIPSTVTGG